MKENDDSDEEIIDNTIYVNEKNKLNKNENNKFDILNNNNNLNNSNSNNNLIHKNKKPSLNYSLIINDVINVVLTNQKNKFIQNEYKINLLLMPSINNLSIKTLYLNLIFIINMNNTDNSIIKYIFNKVYKYHENNREINLKIFSYMLRIISNKLYQQSKYFYSYYFIQKAKKLTLSIKNERELKTINKIIIEILGKANKYVNSKCQLFSDKNKISENNLDNINNILNDILYQNKSENNNINNIEKEEKEEKGPYLFVIDKKWVLKAKTFIDNYKKSLSDLTEKKFLEEAFNEDFVLYSYFNELDNKDKNDSIKTIYPGPINNYNLLYYKDSWEDSHYIDENYIIKNNLVLNKDYYLISETYWNTLDEIFDSTNIIKRQRNNLEYIELKTLILEERLKNNLNHNLLRRRIIQIRNNSNIKQLKEKIIRCISYSLKKKNDENNIDDEQNNQELENLDENKNIYFYISEKKNKNILAEICTAFTNNNNVYDSFLLKEIKINEEESVNSLFNFYSKSKHILIIEIVDKDKAPFLQEIKPILNENKIYKCDICKKEIEAKNRYDCGKCNISLFCSENCCNKSQNHEKFHNVFGKLLKPEFNLDILNKNNIKYIEGSRMGYVGLINLGNTCYLNSTIHCLSNSILLTKYFIFDFYKDEQNFFNFDSQGNIIEEYAKLMKNMWIRNEEVISPENFRKSFCKINPEFWGNLVKDPYEFLSDLLKTLHNNLNRIITKQDSKEFEEKKENDNEIEEAKRWENCQKLKNDSIIYDLFNGQFISSKTCVNCGKKLTSFEQFNILSLPIPQSYMSIKIKYFTEKEYKNFSISINENSNFIDLKEKALSYYYDEIIKKFLKDYSYGDFNENEIIDNEDEEQNNYIIYDNKKINKYRLYKYIDIIILNKNKYIINNKINDKDKIFSILEKEEDEIVLYEKETISNNSINIYVSASEFSIKKNIFIKKKENIYSYPVLIQIEKNLLIENLDGFIKKKFKNILKNTKEDFDKLINIIIFHNKNIPSCAFCQKNYEENKFCVLKDLFNKNYPISELSKEYTDIPIFLGASSKYYSIDKKNSTVHNNILFINSDSNEENENKCIRLYDCFENFKDDKLFENDNKYLCKDCKGIHYLNKKLQICKTPLYLIIHLKRPKTNLNKIEKIIDKLKKKNLYINEVLDLNEYIIGPEKNIYEYQLYGNIIYNDSHCYAYCKKDEKWIQFDDEKFSKSSFSQSQKSYLLFYRKKVK